jgi:hypothetical protein
MARRALGNRRRFSYRAARMPTYPDSRDDRAWEVFLRLRAASPQPLADQKAREASAEQLARQAYHDVDAFPWARVYFPPRRYRTALPAATGNLTRGREASRGRLGEVPSTPAPQAATQDHTTARAQ